MGEWENRRIEEWENGRKREWENGGMGEWENRRGRVEDVKSEELKLMSRVNISSGTPWEKAYGYSRAVRIANIIEIEATAILSD